MINDTRLTLRGRPVPVVAFFGTKGGVGKTTIARRFAELVTMAPSQPNVLLMDADVHHRGMTVEMSAETPVTCKTIHDYIATQNTSDIVLADLSGLVQGRTATAGQLFFLPASTPESDHIFEESAKIGADHMLDILHQVACRAVEKYECACVVIDCGPIIDPYTAAATMLADRAFIIGQNEPISFSSLKSYPSRIRDFFPTFSTAKMKVIVNKVRGWESLEQRKQIEDIFHAIPFTMDIVDVSEGLSATNQMQLMMFEDHIRQIVQKVFKGDHPDLIPKPGSTLQPEWQALVDKAGNLDKAAPIKRLGLLRLLLPVGLLVTIAGGVFFYVESAGRHRGQRATQAKALIAAMEGMKEAGGAEASAKVKAAQELIRSVNPNDQATLDAAINACKDAGLDAIPPVKRQDAHNENLGVGVLLGGLAVFAIGLNASRKRKSYLDAINSLRQGGAEWLTKQMSEKRSSRKTLDNLVKMAQ